MFKKLLARAVRSLVATLIAHYLTVLQHDPRYIAAAPVLMTLGKWVREIPAVQRAWPKLAQYFPV